MSVTRNQKRDPVRPARSDRSGDPGEEHGAHLAGRAPGVMEVRFASASASAAPSYRVVTFGSLGRLAQRAGLDQAGLASFLGVSTKTLKRRAAKGVLDEAESMKTEMLAYTLHEACRVMDDEGKARRWLVTQVASLDGLRPIDHLDSIEGYERVRETLTKIEYGMY